MTREEITNYRVVAKDRLRDDAIESHHIIVYGMAPLYSDDPMYDILQCDPSLCGHTHIEADFYTSRIKPGRIELCCHCAREFDSLMELHSHLKHREGPYFVALPVCKACLENGCNIIVCAAIQHARAKQSRINDEAVKESGRQYNAALEAAKTDDITRASTPVATPAATPVATPAPKPKSRMRTSTRCECLYILLLPFLLLHVL